MTLELNDAEFQARVIDAKEPFFVDFWAPWCGPCRMIAPIVDELATEYAGRITVAKINVDDNQGVTSQYGITSIPALLIFVGGELKERAAGAMSKAALKQLIDKHVK